MFPPGANWAIKIILPLVHHQWHCYILACWLGSVYVLTKSASILESVIVQTADVFLLNQLWIASILNTFFTCLPSICNFVHIFIKCGQSFFFFYFCLFWNTFSMTLLITSWHNILLQILTSKKFYLLKENKPRRLFLFLKR